MFCCNTCRAYLLLGWNWGCEYTDVAGKLDAGCTGCSCPGRGWAQAEWWVSSSYNKRGKNKGVVKEKIGPCGKIKIDACCMGFSCSEEFIA